MEAKVEFDNAGTLIITCGQFKLIYGTLWKTGGDLVIMASADLDALYAVLHARELCKTSDTYARRIEEAIKHAD